MELENLVSRSIKLRRKRPCSPASLNAGRAAGGSGWSSLTPWNLPGRRPSRSRFRHRTSSPVRRAPVLNLTGQLNTGRPPRPATVRNVSHLGMLIDTGAGLATGAASACSDGQASTGLRTGPMGSGRQAWGCKPTRRYPPLQLVYCDDWIRPTSRVPLLRPPGSAESLSPGRGPGQSAWRTGLASCGRAIRQVPLISAGEAHVEYR